MNLTRIRFTSLGLPFALAAVAALCVAACGQLTGLSDDYAFDLVEGGAKADAVAADAPIADAPIADGPVTDGPTPDAADAGKTCSAGESATALTRLNTFGGTAICKACLAPACCDDVEACFHNPDCNRVLGCKLDCTSRPSSERQQCLKDCNTAGGAVPALYTDGIAVCAAAACKQQCPLQ